MTAPFFRCRLMAAAKACFFRERRGAEMLEIISGRAGSGKTAYCLAKIKERLVAEPMGRAIFLLLPEHMTYKAEHELASMLAAEGKGFSRCYVYGFRRFAYRILQETGGGLEKGLTELGRILLLRRLLDKRLKEKSLTSFARAARQKGFVHELSDVINEMKTYCLSPEVLQELAQQVGEENSLLQGKLGDMAAICRDFHAAMEGQYLDGKDILAKLLEKLPQSALTQGAEIWLDGFQFFNPLEQEVLQQLAAIAAEIHVTITADTSVLNRGSRYNQAARENIFYRSYQTRNYFFHLAEENSLPVQEIFLEQTQRFSTPVLQQLEGQWNGYRLQPVQANDDIQLVEAATVRLELEAMADNIVRQVREEGFKWQDIGILVRDEDTYGFLTELVLQEYKIPFFNAAKRQTTHHPLAELLRSALAICTGRQGWSYENMFRCLKTGFFKESCGLLPDTLDVLENYVLEFGIKGKKTWNQEEPWHYAVSRKNYGGAAAGEAEELRDVMADTYRRQLAQPLLHLYEALRQGKGYSELAEFIYCFLEELQVPRQLEAWSKEDEAAGNLAGSREHHQLWNAIMELLDQLAELGQQEGENLLTGFADMVQEGLDNMNVSLIPPGMDYVSLASFEQNSLDNIRAIYILGANAGIMPKHSSENVILSDGERIRINNTELMSAGGNAGALRRLSVIGQENSYNEGYVLYKGFTRAREYLWVSYALSDDSGSGKEPARIVKWLRRLAPGVKLRQVLQGEAFAAADRQALSGLGSAMRNCRDYGGMEEKWQAVYDWMLDKQGKDKADRQLGKVFQTMRKALRSKHGSDKLPQELARELFAPKGFIRGSVTRLECYNNCPFQYYAKYGLQLQERKVRRFSNPELGTLLHGVLREFGERLKKENRRWGDITEDMQRAMCHEILHRLAHGLENNMLFQQKQLEMQLKRIENTANFALARLCAFDRVSRLHPEYYEKGFGYLAQDSNEKAVQLVYKLTGQAGLSINGQIDRIDITEDGSYFMIMDYKTGSAAINIMDVYYGIKLQLLTYILAAAEILAREQGKKSLPVAMLYYFLKKPVISLENHLSSQGDMIQALEDKMKMPGWVVADKQLVQLLDSTLCQPGGTSRFIHASLTKSTGEITKSALYLRTERELELLLAYVEQLLQATGEKILAGEIQPEPYRRRDGSSGCGYCPYKVICGFDAQLEGFGYKKTMQKKDIDFMEDIEAELAPGQVKSIDARLEKRIRQRAQENEEAE